MSAGGGALLNIVAVGPCRDARFDGYDPIRNMKPMESVICPRLDGMPAAAMPRIEIEVIAELD